MAGLNPIGTDGIGIHQSVDVFVLKPIKDPVNPPSQNKVAVARFGLRDSHGKTSSTFTQKQKTFRYQGQRWEGEFEFIEFDHHEVKEWKAWLASLEGRNHNFQLEPPYEAPRGKVNQNGTVKSISRPNAITIQGLASNTNTIFDIGDYIEITDTNELKMISSATDSNSSGEATVFVEPIIRKKPEIGSTVETQSPKGLFQLKNNEIGWKTNPDFTEMSIEFVEVVKNGT